MSIATFLVGNLHVGESDGNVVRYIYSKFKRDAKGRVKATRAERHAIYVEALAAHHENQRLYRDMRF